MMSYTKKQTKDKLISTITNISTLYCANCINWTGKTKDTKEYYTEIISFELLRELKVFDSIGITTRKNSYSRENHCDIRIDICKSNRDEENFAKRITGLTLDDLGTIIDYQVPLKDTLSNKGLGKIDLISFNAESKKMFLIELKYMGNKETLLRTILESYTYFKIIDKMKLKKDFSDKFGNIDLEDIIIIPTVLVVPNCNAFGELEEMEIGQRPKLKALALALGIKFFTLEFFINESTL